MLTRDIAAAQSSTPHTTAVLLSRWTNEVRFGWQIIVKLLEISEKQWGPYWLDMASATDFLLEPVSVVCIADGSSWRGIVYHPRAQIRLRAGKPLTLRAISALI